MVPCFLDGELRCVTVCNAEPRIAVGPTRIVTGRLFLGSGSFKPLLGATKLTSSPYAPLATPSTEDLPRKSLDSALRIVTSRHNGVSENRPLKCRRSPLSTEDGWHLVAYRAGLSIGRAFVWRETERHWQRNQDSVASTWIPCTPRSKSHRFDRQPQWEQ